MYSTAKQHIDEKKEQLQATVQNNCMPRVQFGSSAAQHSHTKPFLRQKLSF